MPDDWALNPPIEVLPQMLQARDMIWWSLGSAVFQARVTAGPVPGRSLVTKRAIRGLVRSATLSVYGVSGFAGGGPAGRLLERLGIAQPGLHLEVGDELTVDLQLTVAYGLPVAEVARQVETAVRYTLRNAIGREPDRITIRI